MYVPSRLRKKIDWLFRRAEGRLLDLGDEAAHLDPDGARLALVASTDDLAITGWEGRLEALERAETDAQAREEYAQKYGVSGVRCFRAGGTRIYALEVETFPRHVNNVHLLREDETSILFDCGSGFPTSRRDLALGFAIVRTVFGEDARWEELDLCVVSHGHADHCGGVNHLRETSRAAIAIHELDVPVIADFEARLAAVTIDVDAFWQRAGVPADERAAWVTAYTATKSLFRSERVDCVLRDGDLVGPGYRVHHVPGHCPGLVCLDVHGTLLTSDHVLARTTPHQFPASLMPFAGLAHYFESLTKIRGLGIARALGGHEEPIADLPVRIDAIAAFHETRLARITEILQAPHSIREVADALFGERDGFERVLAVEEAGAHVEYLHGKRAIRLESDGRYVAR